MFGNILILIALIFYGCLFNLLLKPMPGGDYGVGYSIVWIIYVAGFFISTGLLAWNMNQNHCFDWLPAFFLRYRNLLVFLGWITFIVAIIFSLGYQSNKVEKELPQFLTWFTWSRVYIWLPLLMLIPSLYLINAERLTGFAPSWVKISIQMGFAVSVFMVLVLLFSFLKISAQQQRKDDLIWAQQNKRAHYGPLEFIAEHKTTDPIVNILQYIGRHQNENVRSAAIAKIKERPDWENDLIQLLDNDFNLNHEVYTFLDAYKVEHTEKFLEPINRNILRLAEKFQTDIKQSQILEPWFFNGYDIERRLRVIDTQFANKGFNFRPAVLKLQEALATERQLPSDNDVQFDEQKVVKDWLEKH
jgi:low affinity Fe/Cu permease